MRHTEDVTMIVQDRIQQLHAERANDALVAMLVPATRPMLLRTLGQALIEIGHWLRDERTPADEPIVPGAPERLVA